MDTLLTVLILNLALVSPNKDTIYVKDASLAEALSTVWCEHPIDTIKTPVIITIDVASK